MNADENVAYRYLCREFGESRVIYEPDGNVPPDFLIKAGPAIEVRRLNRNDFDGDSPKGLEETFIPRWDSAYDFFPKLGPPQQGQSWFVVLRFRAPTISWKELLAMLRTQLQTFQAKPEHQPLEWQVAEGVRIELIPCSNKQESAFLLGSIDNDNQAYWVISELIANIEYCAHEKLEKIAPYRGRYENWWLVIVDHIAFGPTDEDMSQLREHLRTPSGWDKVVLVGGKEAEHVSEI